VNSPKRTENAPKGYLDALVWKERRLEGGEFYPQGVLAQRKKKHSIGKIVEPNLIGSEGKSPREKEKEWKKKTFILQKEVDTTPK